jgi:PAS domain S-box-containing protein
MKNREFRDIIQVVTVYAVVSWLWIYFSDTLMGMIFTDPAIITRVSIYKGFAFIFFTSIVLYLLIKHYVRQLNEHQNFIEKVVNLSPVVLYIYDISNNKNIYSNDGIQKILGFSPGEIKVMGDKLLEKLMHPEDYIKYRQEIVPRYLKVKDGEVIIYQFRLKSKHGKWIWLESSELIYKRDNTSFPLEILGLSHDITERKNSEEVLLETQSILQMSLKHSPYYSFIKEVSPTDSRVLYVSDNFEEMVGFSSEKMIGKTMTELFPFEMTAKMTEDDWSVVSKNTVIEIEEEFNGRLYSTVKFPIVFGNKKMLGGHTRDITKKKQAEVLLEISNANLRGTLDATADGILAIDSNGKIIFSNKVFAGLWKIPQTIVDMGDDNALLGHVLEQLLDPEAFLKKISFLYNSLDNSFDTIDFKDGRIFERYSIPLKVDNSQQIGRVWSFRDVTEQKKNELDLQNAKLAADRANQAKSTFLANMSHELRTPLNGVLGFTTLLEQESLSLKHKEFLNYISQSGKNLLALINDILDLSKAEAESIELSNSELNLQSIINEILASQNLLAKAKNISLKITISSDLQKIYLGDALRLKQILNNFISNAVKFTKVGEVSVSVNLLSKKESSDLVQFMISDTGIGISPESLGIIFKPFVQASSGTTCEFGGTGLGLAISKKLVKLMGGQISVSSALGKGSTFSFEIPLMKSAMVEYESEKIKNFDQSSALKNLKVLLVEDNPANLQLGIEILTAFDCQVKAVERATEALKLFKNENFDLLLIDIQMPGMGGDEMIKLIRDSESPTKIHQMAIALTANALQGHKEQYLHAGFDGYVPKPIEIDILREEMKRVLNIK